MSLSIGIIDNYTITGKSTGGGTVQLGTTTGVPLWNPPTITFPYEFFDTPEIYASLQGGNDIFRSVTMHVDSINTTQVSFTPKIRSAVISYLNSVPTIRLKTFQDNNYYTGGKDLVSPQTAVGYIGNSNGHYFWQSNSLMPESTSIPFLQNRLVSYDYMSPIIASNYLCYFGTRNLGSPYVQFVRGYQCYGSLPDENPTYNPANQGPSTVSVSTVLPLYGRADFFDTVSELSNGSYRRPVLYRYEASGIYNRAVRYVGGTTGVPTSFSVDPWSGSGFPVTVVPANTCGPSAYQVLNPGYSSVAIPVYPGTVVSGGQTGVLYGAGTALYNTVTTWPEADALITSINLCEVDERPAYVLSTTSASGSYLYYCRANNHVGTSWPSSLTQIASFPTGSIYNARMIQLNGLLIFGFLFDDQPLFDRQLYTLYTKDVNATGGFGIKILRSQVETFDMVVQNGTGLIMCCGDMPNTDNTRRVLMNIELTVGTLSWVAKYCP